MKPILKKINGFTADVKAFNKCTRTCVTPHEFLYNDLVLSGSKSSVEYQVKTLWGAISLFDEGITEKDLREWKDDWSPMVNIVGAFENNNMVKIRKGLRWKIIKLVKALSNKDESWEIISNRMWGYLYNSNEFGVLDNSEHVHNGLYVAFGEYDQLIKIGFK
jgi:hypothetical protein